MNARRTTWRTADLIEDGVLEIGDGYRAKNSELSMEGLPFARAGNIDDGFQFDDCDRFPLKDIPRVGNKVSAPGDVVFTSKGTVGRFAFVRDETPQFVYSPQLCFWRSTDKDRLDPRFLFCWIRGDEFWEQADAMKGQTDMADYVSLRDQRRMQITLPELGEQRGVARLVGALDDKIELNRRMNRTLEELAAALFRSWFVDFDPVVAKAAGRPPAHLRPDLAALFPATFQDSPLGPIPHCWRVRQVNEVVEFNPVRRLAKGASAPYLDMQNMPTDSALPANWVIRPHGSGMKFQNGDTLLARITPCLENGKTAFVNALADGEVGWGSTEYIVMRPLPPLPLEYGYFLARSDDFRAHAIANMTGSSGRQRVPASCFDNYLVVEPPKEIAVAFGNIAAPFMRMMKANTEQSRTLAALRDTLLPKLLSGELRVKHAEKELSSHA